MYAKCMQSPMKIIRIVLCTIIIIIIIMALQPFVGPWALFQFLDPVHGW
jgi:hypothetical protein